MFGRRYFGGRYFGPRYFADGGTEAPASGLPLLLHAIGET